MIRIARENIVKYVEEILFFQIAYLLKYSLAVRESIDFRRK